MDTETLWILKKLAARDISVQSADRILRALALLQKSEKHGAMNSAVAAERDISTEASQGMQQRIPAETELSLLEDTGTSVQEIEEDAEEAQETAMEPDELPKTQQQERAISAEEASEGIVGAENEPSEEIKIQNKTRSWEFHPPVEDERETMTAEMGRQRDKGTKGQGDGETRGQGDKETRPLLGNDGIGIIEDIPDGMELMLEKSGDVIIQGWNRPHIRAEGKLDSSTVLRSGRSLKIETENDVTLYIPAAVEGINIASGSGPIDIRNYPNNIVIDSDTGDINISEVGGTIALNSIESDITLENCRGVISLESKFGNIVVKKTPPIQTVEMELLEDDIENILKVTGMNIESDSGDVTLTDISCDMDIKTNMGNITLERCRGHNISVESSGGGITLRNMANNVNLKNENGSIEVDGFSGAVSIETKDTEISLKNISNTEIHVESDGGDIRIEDCYADVYIDSDKSNVFLSESNSSLDEMGRMELRMKTGDAYLHGRAFEDVHVVIDEGNAEINMEKLNPEGSVQISVYRGDVTVGVLPSFACELTAHGSRNNMFIELPVEIVEKDKNRLRAMLNGGGSKMEIIAPNGEIRFRALELPHTKSNKGGTIIDL